MSGWWRNSPPIWGFDWQPGVGMIFPACREKEQGMRLCLVLLAAMLALAGCSGCNDHPNVNAGVGIGSSGTHSHMSVGQSCGPMNVRVGSGGMGLGLHL